MMKFTAKQKAAGELAIRRASGPALRLYNETEDLTVYEYETEDGTMYAYGLAADQKTVEGLPFSELVADFEALQAEIDKALGEED